MKALIMLLPILFTAVLAYLSGYYFGRREGQHRTALNRQQRKHYTALIEQQRNLYRLAADHALTEPFAMIVMDELREKEQR